MTIPSIRFDHRVFTMRLFYCYRYKSDIFILVSDSKTDTLVQRRPRHRKTKRM